MSDDLIIDVGALFGRLEKSRTFSGARHVVLRLVDSLIDGPMEVVGSVVGTADGVQSEFRAEAVANLMCVRCLTTWTEKIDVDGSQHFSAIPDEDGYAVVHGLIDVGAPAMDELALGLPAAPVCRKECRGLCPICGTDLNSDPCDGHGDDSDSPFAVLRDLFDS
jgi:uncharacterized protein